MIGYFLLSLIPLLVFLVLRSKKAFHMLQQNWYNDDKRYLTWIRNNYNKVLIEIDLLFIVFILGLYIEPLVMMSLYAIFYLLISYFYHKKRKGEQSKKPLVITKRINRLTITLGIMYLIPLIIMISYFNLNTLIYYYLTLSLLVYLNYFIVLIANIINIPIEKFVFNYYKRHAMKKLHGMNNLKVIGITGSYGKTSSKNILSDILNVKFNAFATPKSFNTPYGLINAINNYLDKFSEYFIAEMGAFKIGEIRQTCDLVHPKYGILTKIGTAHLESFGSQENIQKGKFELIESLPLDGVGILNGDDELQVNYALRNMCKIIWFGIDNHETDLYATNIKLSYKGTTFDIAFKEEQGLYPFETKLLGSANVYNILASVALGYELGMTIPQLQLGVKKVQPIEHRLELKKYGKINIIDDAYNSNPVGSKMAVEVLGMMPGKKIIVTPGMIELGSRQYELNKRFGEYMALVADEVILVGEEQTKPIYDGLMSKNFDKSKIHIINDVKEAFALMQSLQGEETYVLLENDLPDIFNEK